MQIDALPAVAGFADPVTDSQVVFRAVLTAMSEPGRIVTLERLPHPPAGLSPAAAAVLLALADFETPLWLAARDDAAAAYLRFETGAPLIADPRHAAFAYVARSVPLPPFDTFAQGQPEYPDRSTTLVVDIAGLSDERGFTLSGPGIAATARLSATPLPSDFPRRMAENRARFPLGLDLVLSAGDRIACLPRSVTIA